MSYSSFFILLFVPNKTKKRAVSAEGEGPATAETTYPLLVPSRLLRVREAWNHQYERSLKIEKGGGRASARASPLFPVNIDGKETDITSLFLYVRTPLFQGGAALLPANPAIFEPFFPTQRTDLSILAIPGPALCVVMYMFRLAGHYRSSGMARRRGGS